MNKKNMVIVVLATLCLMVTVLSMIPVMSAPAYNPWLDVNESGSIDVKDYQIIKNAIPSVGDPTKNVTIAGHANKLAYYVKNELVPATSWFTSDPILVDGYSKMTISLTFSESEFDYHLWTTHDSSNFVFRLDMTDETAWRPVNCKTYEVVNMYIKIRVYNPGTFEGVLNLDVYLIP